MRVRSIGDNFFKISVLMLMLCTLSSLFYFSGCGGGSSNLSLNPPTCNVPKEAYFNSMDRIGGSVTDVVKFDDSDGNEWTLFNISNELRATRVDVTKSTEYSIEVAGSIKDIDIVLHDDGTRYVLLAMGEEGIAVVNVTNPSNMTKETSVKVNYDHAGINWAEGGGDIVLDNNITSKRAPISSLAIYDDGNISTPLQLIIGDEGYGLHKTAFTNLLDTVSGRELDGTLKIDDEVYTLQYAGENPWGGPKNLTMHGTGVNSRLFVAQGFLGIGIFNPSTLEEVGHYNLYTDATEDNGGEDWFIDMNVATEVQTGFIDACTGMPDYNQASFEIIEVWHGEDNTSSTPWADFDRYGKFYYDARNIDIATFESNTTIAYIAYGLAGMVAVDVTGYETALPRDKNCTTDVGFLKPTYMGFVPAVPAHGTDEETGEDSQSLYPYFGAGMLKEAGVIDVKVNSTTNQVYFSDHFAGLLILDFADDPINKWHGTDENGNEVIYDNDTSTDPANVLGDHWPDYEFVTSYDMTPIEVNDEALPNFLFYTPILLATGEVSGHGNAFALSASFDPSVTSGVDVILTSGGGGLSFMDVSISEDPKFSVSVHIATTDEIGSAADGSATQEINIGHSEGINTYNNLAFLADGPHGMSVWQIADEACTPTDNVHLVANSLQSEYPIDVNGTTINPTPHAYDVILDVVNNAVLVMSQSRGIRRIDDFVAGLVGDPYLLYPENTDIFEHNKDSGNVVDFLKMQDHTYSVALKGSLAFTADGSNGLTVYDLSKDPTVADSGYIVSNIGGDTDSQPDLGHATGVALWTDIKTKKDYAFVAAGHAGIGVVDVSDEHNMTLIKVFEPIKMEDDHVGKADGKSVAVKVVGDYAYFTYDSFGIVNYSIADLIAPLVPETDPTQIWERDGLDQRPIASSRFKLQDSTMFGSADLKGWGGGAAGMDVVQLSDKNLFYIAYGDAGVVKIDWTSPTSPILVEHANTVGSALDISIINGRAYVADGGGGFVLFK